MDLVLVAALAGGLGFFLGMISAILIAAALLTGKRPLRFK